MTFALEGKSAIVTGAGGGINLAFAKKLLEAGTNVLIADLYLTPEAEHVVAQYKDNPRVVFQKTDVSIWADLEAMFKTAQEHFGAIDIVCPGAGVFEPPSSNFWFPPGSPQSKDDIASNGYKLLDINTVHPIRVAQMAISHFLASSVGPTNPKRIVFIASIAGETAFLPIPLYHASKWAIMGFVRSLASLDEYFGIKVGAVAPGIVKTRLWTDDETKIGIVTAEETGQLQATWTTAEEVADAMIAIVRDNEVDNGKGEKIQLVSGTVVEVGHAALREVPLFGNMGPDFTNEGMALANMPGAYKEVITSLYNPGWGKFQDA